MIANYDKVQIKEVIKTVEVPANVETKIVTISESNLSTLSINSSKNNCVFIAIPSSGETGSTLNTSPYDYGCYFVYGYVCRTLIANNCVCEMYEKSSISASKPAQVSVWLGVNKVKQYLKFSDNNIVSIASSYYFTPMERYLCFLW